MQRRNHRQVGCRTRAIQITIQRQTDFHHGPMHPQIHTLIRERLMITCACMFMVGPLSSLRLVSHLLAQRVGWIWRYAAPLQSLPKRRASAIL